MVHIISKFKDMRNSGTAGSKTHGPLTLLGDIAGGEMYSRNIQVRVELKL